MDTKQKGNVTELEILAYITKLGYQVSIPFGDRERYDQIWDVNGKLLKIQIKTSSGNDELIKFSCRSSNRKNGKNVNRRYKPEEIDYFSTFWNGKCYLVPLSETSNEKLLRFKPPKNGQKLRINFAKDYEVEKVLENI